MAKCSAPLTTPLLAILACLLWSTAFVGVKIGLRYSEPLSFAGIRFMLSGLILVPFWWKKRPSAGTVSSHFRGILSVSFFQTTLLYGLFYAGMTRVSGALAAIIVGASPLIAALAAHFFMPDDEMTPAKGLSLCIGMAGVLIISISRNPWTASAGPGEFLGILLLVLSGVSSALGNIVVARDRHHTDPVFLNSAQIFLGGVTLFLISLPLEGLPRLIQPPAYYGALLWLALLSAVAFSLWFMLLKRPGVRVSELNLWKFIIPVCGALLSWIILPGESPRLVPVIGMICIAGAIVLFNLSAMFRNRELKEAAGKYEKPRPHKAVVAEKCTVKHL
ncbi:EamA family transporter [Desulfonema ishimotonii]|uniref:EamA family transporter n=1 Tax=Desulfonema ishimotonii TaxID=45657 RepID=A0A401G320_9BACT|nr:DMT family transporter [Desulfonema ishimotonii]GBC63627.1 EamA family transporter [Desulfonema ishimotonii]